MQERIIVVATNMEYDQIKPLTNIKILKTGVGYTNVIEKLRKLDVNTKIINIGYAGSNIIPLGEIVKVKDCYTFHPNAGEIDENVYKLGGNVDCYTAGDFVLSTEIKKPVVFDMELAGICALGFKNVESYKVVSDTLSFEQFNQANFIDCFKKIIKEIEK